jgi:hypothetical protein
MKVFLSCFGEIFSSRVTTRFIAIAWLFHIWGSIWYLAPGPDDAVFITQALGLIYKGDLGLMYLDRFQPFFINLPGYAFMQGLFYLIWDFVGLPINFFTYKIFHLGSLTLLLFTSVCLIRRLSGDSMRLANFRTNIFLLILSVSPFVIDSLYPRPEPLGLLLTALGLLLFQVAETATLGTARFYALSAFCFGLAATTHPSFILVAGILCLFAAFRLFLTRKIRILVLCAVAATAPMAVVVTWFMLHAPESIEMLTEHVRYRTKNSENIGSGLSLMLKYAGFQHSGSFAVKAYYAVCFVTLIAALSGMMFVTVRAYFCSLRRELAGPQLMVVMFGLSSLINIAISSSPRIQLYTVVGFSAVFVLATLVQLPGKSASREII